MVVVSFKRLFHVKSDTLTDTSQLTRTDFVLPFVPRTAICAMKEEFSCKWTLF